MINYVLRIQYVIIGGKCDKCYKSNFCNDINLIGNELDYIHMNIGHKLLINYEGRKEWKPATFNGFVYKNPDKIKIIYDDTPQRIYAVENTLVKEHPNQPIYHLKMI